METVYCKLCNKKIRKFRVKHDWNLRQYHRTCYVKLFG